MIVEIAEFHIRPGEQAAFEEAMGKALGTITAKAKGMLGYKLQRSVQSPERYLVQVNWETKEDHQITYLQSPEHDAWRLLVRPFYARPATYEYFTTVTAA